MVLLAAGPGCGPPSPEDNWDQLQHHHDPECRTGARWEIKVALFVLVDGLSGSLSLRLASSFTTDLTNGRRETSAAEFAGQEC